MTVKHVINDQLAMGYAAGVLPEAFDLVVVSHISLSDEARARVNSFEAVGGCVMEDCDAVSLDGNAFAATLERIKSADIVTDKPTSTGILPAPIQAYVGGDVDAVKWRSLGGGVKQAILPTKGDAEARLLYIPAGQSVPDHGHRGTELTLVLQGSFSDEVDQFGRGDLEIADEDLDHQPVAGLDAACICIAATDAPLRFNGLLPRLLQPFFKI